MPGIYVSNENYITYIKQIINDHSDRKIIYLPHRRETITPELEALYNDNFTIYQPDAPVELDFMMRKIYPMHVVSFFSTALYTLKHLYSNAHIESYVIPDEDRYSNVRSLLKESYLALEHSKVITVNLKKSHKD